ncbi:wall-associated receptor kinase-like 22 [Euphorbia lathyris]|uniref:wall-associated receptor kinase-like 22 n=1 Tax=Euphorbia lathyris TaxID=212925 RepID=UPI003313CDAE
MSSLSNTFLFLSITLFLSLLPFPSISATPLHPTLNTTCDATCGAVPIKFPFGTGYGCGHPDFARYVTCNSHTLQFSTTSGIYTISSIDYQTNTLIITDPLMSTCDSMQNSGSLSLDRASPFTLTSDNIFVLLGCSTTSPVFDSSQDLCERGSRSRVCRGMYSCKGIAGIGLPENAEPSTCCVYESPIQLGGYRLDLPKLQCSSYTSIYSFGGNEGDPMRWRFGIVSQYNGSYYSDMCKDCESSGGVCGFAGLDQSFSCICRNGKKTSTSCFGQGGTGYAWSGTWRSKVHNRMSYAGIFLVWLWLLLPI